MLHSLYYFILPFWIHLSSSVVWQYDGVQFCRGFPSKERVNGGNIADFFLGVMDCIIYTNSENLKLICLCVMEISRKNRKNLKLLSCLSRFVDGLSAQMSESHPHDYFHHSISRDRSDLTLSPGPNFGTRTRAWSTRKEYSLTMQISIVHSTLSQ